jgi:hypothetical protein
MTAEQYNRLRGPVLSYLVMELVKASQVAKEEINVRQVWKRYIAQEAVPDGLQERLYYRILYTLRALQAGNVVKLTSQFHQTKRVNVILITLP